MTAPPLWQTDEKMAKEAQSFQSESDKSFDSKGDEAAARTIFRKQKTVAHLQKQCTQTKNPHLETRCGSSSP